MIDDMDSPKPESDAADATTSAFPTEPFACPACGQLLAPSCRVCVACRHTIDPAAIVRAAEPAISTVAEAAPLVEKPAPPPVRFPWPLFFAVLAVLFVMGLALQPIKEHFGEHRAQWFLWGVQILVWMASVWVYFDARRRRVPYPLRWGICSVLLFAVVFPWYLARRRQPESPVPFVEAKVGPVGRFLLVALIVFIVLNVVTYFVMGPAAK